MLRRLYHICLLWLGSIWQAQQLLAQQRSLTESLEARLATAQLASRAARDGTRSFGAGKSTNRAVE